MKIALVLCPGWNRDVPHLAFALLAAAVRAKGHEVSVYDCNARWYKAVESADQQWWEDSHTFLWSNYDFVERFISNHNSLLEEAVEEILASGATVIGFSVYSTTELLSRQLSLRLKKRYPSLHIIWGGHRCARYQHPADILNSGYVDTIVIGEGDITLPELLEQIDRKGYVESCLGTIVRRGNEIFDGGDRSPYLALDTLPCPDFSDFDFTLYKQSRALPALFSRGCIHRCVFCTVGAMWHGFRSLSGNRMFEHLLYYFKALPQLEKLLFFDPLINGNIRALEQFCDAVISAREKGLISGLRWRGEAVIREEMTEALLHKMAKAGCYSIYYGIESGSNRVLSSMQKPFSIALADKVLRMTTEAGIATALNFMFGFPTEGDEDFQCSLDFLSRNRSYIQQVIPSESFCNIEEGTYLYEHKDEFGIAEDCHSEYWQTQNGKNTFERRLERFEQFCLHALSLGISVGSGYETVRLRKQQRLADYYDYKTQYGKFR